MKKIYGLIFIAFLAQFVAEAKDPIFRKLGKKKKETSFKTAAPTTKTLPQIEKSYYWDEEANEYVYSASTRLTYDAQGNVIRRATYYNGNDTSMVSTYTYNENGDLTSYLGQQYDDVNDVYVNSFKSEYTFDSKGNQTEYGSYNWNTSTDSWELNSGEKTIYSYDSYGRVTDEERQTYDNTLDAWDRDYKDIYEYTGTSEAFTSITEFEWNGSVWVQADKYYDIVWQNFTEDMPKSYSFEEDGEVGRSNIVFTGSNYVETKEINEDGSWVFSERNSMTVETDKTTFLDEVYTNDEWVIKIKNINFVDSHGNTEGYEEYNLNGLTMELELGHFSHTINTYANNGNLIAVESETGTGSTATYKTKTEYSDFKTITVTSIAAPSVELVAAYPNPTKDIVTLDNLGLENKFIKVYNTQNNEVISVETMDNKVQLNLANLTEGLYILKAQTASGKILTAKIVKQ